MSEISIRALRTLAEMRPAVELQRQQWGDDIESVVPAHMLFSLANHGGPVLGAFDGERMIGLLIGFLGTHMEQSHRPAMANLQIVSKRMVVSPDYRSSGIGYRLKLAQRDFAVKQGVRLIVWTFDPLLAPNAHLNLRKLGVLCPEYRENYYGTEAAGGLASMGASDRLIVEWWVTSRRVEERLFGSRGDLTLNQYLETGAPILNLALVGENGLLQPSDRIAFPQGSFALLEIPLNYTEMLQRDVTLANAWRLHTRALFQQMFAEGFIVTDFLRENYEGRNRGFYLFSFNVGFDPGLN